MDVSVRTVKESDFTALARIYNHYVSTTVITFETEPVTEAEMAHRVSEALATSLPWLVAEAAGCVVGYAYASKWKGRCAYRFSVEATIYLDASHTGKGVGSQLYKALIAAIRAASMHAVIGGIALPNEPSIGLHERLGFKKVAHFEQVGYKQDRWVDVGYWQLLL
ncbi:arsinothricin resistance N-acetyltransferase ArsN1 family B [Pseudoxanthomonas koreensis]|uniref:arsinothricin resistance N-acetyltransferase ArsN1 family B n=1 Tax=Pseudoxanthomonas koreensis TaxID=266061 RepID=UPI0035A71E12